MPNVSIRFSCDTEEWKSRLNSGASKLVL
jgi:hypothetical protein